jgi:hypothetical protein|tara:strand:+ start:720 stop:1814 length:1095 start_codon:yes stop_codon:yes gene_type:complete
MNKKNIFLYLLFIFIFSLNIISVEVYNLIIENGFELFIYTSIPFLLLYLFFWVHYYKSLTLLILVCFCGLLLFSSFTGLNISFGVKKVFIGLLIPLCLLPLMRSLRGEKKIIFIAFSHLVLVINLIALIYKFKNGFMVRQVNFGLLGPITFGWINAILLVINLFGKFSKKYILIALLMIIWSGSKGPFLISLFFILYYFKNSFSKIRIKDILVATTLLVIVIYNLLPYYEDLRIFKTIVDFYSNSDTYASNAGAGSIGSRAFYFSKAIEIWGENILFGIGFGSWESYVTGHKYPHNLFLEIIAEVGLIGFSVLLLITYRLKKNEYFFIFILGILLQFTSGDFSYFRYYFIFILLGLLKPIKKTV